MVFIHKIGVRFSVAVQWRGGLEKVPAQAHNLNDGGSNPSPATDNNNSGVRVLLRRKVVFSTVRVRIR